MIKKIVLIIPLIFVLTGCYNYRELNDLAIVSAVSISKTGDIYEVATQIVNPKKDTDVSGANEPRFVIYKNQAPSLQEAFRLIVKESPKKIYGTQLQIMIIDEELAKEGINDILDFFARDPEIRMEFFVLVSKNKDILEILTPLDNISSQNIMESLKANSRYLGITSLVTFNDLLNSHQNNKTEIALPTIELLGNEEIGKTEENTEASKVDASAVLSSMTVFKNNKLVGYLTEEESIGYNFIMNQVTNTIITNYYDEDSYIVSEVLKAKSSVEAEVKKQKITIKVKGNAAISEVNYDIDLTKEKEINNYERDLNKKIECMIKDTIKSTNKKFASDIYGFEDLFYKTDAKYYKKIKDDFDKKILPNIDVEVESKIKIVEQGNILGVLKHE